MNAFIFIDERKFSSNNIVLYFKEYIMSENAYTGIISELGVKLATNVAIFTLGLKILISLYNKYIINDSYKFRVINFSKK